MCRGARVTGPRGVEKWALPNKLSLGFNEGMITPAVGASAVSRGVRLGYGVGSFCTATVSTVPGLLLLYYMTNFLAVPAWLAGVVVTAPKVWDLVVNPLIGRWSDRTRSRLGPRRPCCWRAPARCRSRSSWCSRGRR